MTYEAWIIIVCVALAAFFFAVLIQKIRPTWGRQKVTFVAALILPMVAWVWCVGYFSYLYFKWGFPCTEETCGMAPGGIIVFAIFALLSFFFSLPAALMGSKIFAKRQDQDAKDIAK